MTRVADALLTRLVPHTTADAGDYCWTQAICKGHLIPNRCGNQRDRYHWTVCRRDGYDEIVREVFVGCCA